MMKLTNPVFGYNSARETLPAILDIKAQNPYTDFTDSTDLRGFF